MSSKSYPYLLQAIVVLAGFVVLSTFAFAHSTANAIGFGVGIGITLVAAATVALSRGRLARSIAGVSTITGAWMVLVTIGIFAGGTQRWITFAAAAGMVGLTLLAQAAEASGMLERRAPRLRDAADARAA
jgi:hypothetical protein